MGSSRRPIQRLFLPLLEEWSALSAGDTPPDFSKTLLLSVQHLFLTTHAMFLTLFAYGLRPENLFVMGKCYSTRPKVMELMRQDGIHVSLLSNFYDSYLPFDDYFQKNLSAEIELFLTKKKAGSFDKIIVLDEGGGLLSLFYKKYGRKYPIVGIEQTSSGFNKLCREPIPFPVVNVARSRAKLCYETPLVVNLCVDRIKKHLAKHTALINNILILGDGVIGSGMQEALQGMFTTTTLDKKNYKFPKKYRQVLLSTLSTCDAIIGCTGYCSIPKELHTYLKRPTFLLSVSSSDREFDAASLRQKTDQQANCHKDLWIDDLCLVNSGFPYPFDGNYKEIDLVEFQLTRGLLLAAIFQAALLQRRERGFIDLSEPLQKEIVRRWSEERQRGR